MRISGGVAKGRRTASQRLLKKTSGAERLRPTSGKVREALFDIIRGKIEGASFVDLYAGSGTVGLEALSRGAGKAVFVEPDETRLKTIKKNIDEFGFGQKALVMKGKAYEFLERASSENNRFHIFFLDPPYQSEELRKVLPVIGSKGLLCEGGLVIVEHFFKKTMPETADGLKIYRSYRYGDTMLTVYRKAEE